MTLRRLISLKEAGGADWLFVGQIAPHKAQHDVVKAFACYRRVYDRDARLHLVGREMGSAYIDALRRFAVALGLKDAVSLPGSVSAGALVAYYEAADRLRVPFGPRRVLRADRRVNGTGGPRRGVRRGGRARDGR